MKLCRDCEFYENNCPFLDFSIPYEERAAMWSESKEYVVRNGEKFFNVCTRFVPNKNYIV